MVAIVSPFPLLLSSQFGESKFREIGKQDCSSPKVGATEKAGVTDSSSQHTSPQLAPCGEGEQRKG